MSKSCVINLGTCVCMLHGAVPFPGVDALTNWFDSLVSFDA